MRLSASACGVLVAASISGCTTVPQKTYHPVACSSGGCTPRDWDEAIQKRPVHVSKGGWGTKRCFEDTPSPNYSELKYEQAWLEVREDGFLAAPEQLKVITRRIKRAHEEGAPVLLTAYVHGWQGNADERLPPGCDDPNGQVNLYYAQMGRISDTVQRLYDAGIILHPDKVARKRPVVIGVWIGWRGRDYRDFTKLSSPRSFLSRGRTANAIGKEHRFGSLRNALDTLSNSLTDPDDRMMLSGLSFGGRIITQLYQDKLLQRNAAPLGPQGLIVTFNAAVGSDCYEEALKFNDGGREAVVPRWINFTSEEDTIRRVLYRFGSVLVKDDKEFCDPKSKLRRVALGFDKSQLTHEMFAEPDGEAGPVEAFPGSLGDLAWASRPPEDATLTYNTRKYDTLKDGAYGYEEWGSRYKLRFKQTHANTGPLWVVNTDSSLIGAPREWQSLNDRHSKVFTTNLFRLLITTLYDPERVKIVAPTTASLPLHLQVDH